MPLRGLVALIATFALAIVVSGCFASDPSGTTVTQAITLGVGTSETVVNVASGGGGSTSGGETTSQGTTGGLTETQATTGGQPTTGASTSQGGSQSDLAAGKAAFVSTCGGCHTLKDAGTSGKVGPDLDQLKPDAQTVATQIKNGGGAMPANLVTGKKVDQVAAYVAAVAGK